MYKSTYTLYTNYTKISVVGVINVANKLFFFVRGHTVSNSGFSIQAINPNTDKNGREFFNPPIQNCLPEGTQRGINQLP